MWDQKYAMLASRHEHIGKAIPIQLSFIQLVVLNNGSLQGLRSKFDTRESDTRELCQIVVHNLAQWTSFDKATGRPDLLGLPVPTIHQLRPYLFHTKCSLNIKNATLMHLCITAMFCQQAKLSLPLLGSDRCKVYRNSAACCGRFVHLSPSDISCMLELFRKGTHQGRRK